MQTRSGDDFTGGGGVRGVREECLSLVDGFYFYPCVSGGGRGLDPHMMNLIESWQLFWLSVSFSMIADERDTFSGSSTRQSPRSRS